MKDILQFLMIIYSPINSIITTLYQLYKIFYRFYENVKKNKSYNYKHMIVFILFLSLYYYYINIK